MTTIAVVTHKEYGIADDSLYLPLWAGAVSVSEAKTEGYVRDDSGDNISDKNAGYCELTGLWWMWKNSDADNIGICHYRRYFGTEDRHHYAWRFSGAKKFIPASLHCKKRIPKERGQAPAAPAPDGAALLAPLPVLKAAEADGLMQRCSIVLPKPRHYIIETNYSQFAHAHGSAGLDVARQVIADRHPEYLPAFDQRMAMTSGHRFNMFIMRRDLMDAYCTWLFDILFEVERRLERGNIDNKQSCEQPLLRQTVTKKCLTPLLKSGREQAPGGVVPDRLYGHIAERLLDVWLDANAYEYEELPYIFTEKERLIRKAAGMLFRKLTKRNTIDSNAASC